MLRWIDILLFAAEPGCWLREPGARRAGPTQDQLKQRVTQISFKEGGQTLSKLALFKQSNSNSDFHRLLGQQFQFDSEAPDSQNIGNLGQILFYYFR